MSSPITLKGRLTRDPELRFTSGGKAVASVSVVTSRRTKNPAGDWEDKDTSFFDCTAFGQMAENVCESLRKGSNVIVTGAMHQEFWEDKEGNKKSAWRVNVDDIGPSLKWQKNDNHSQSFQDETPF